MQSQTYIYNIDRCSEGLRVSSISPQDESIVTNTIGNINLNVQTAGCINGGDSACYYNFGAGDVLFSSTNSTSHKQIFNSLSDGIHNITIHCVDDAGNEAYGQTNISVRIDQSPPQLVRIYTSDNVLNIRTDEPARCSIAEKNIGEECEMEKDISGSFLALNTFKVENTKTYYVLCEDGFENRNSICQEVHVLN